MFFVIDIYIVSRQFGTENIFDTEKRRTRKKVDDELIIVIEYAGHKNL